MELHKFCPIRIFSSRCLLRTKQYLAHKLKETGVFRRFIFDAEKLSTTISLYGRCDYVAAMNYGLLRLHDFPWFTVDWDIMACSCKAGAVLLVIHANFARHKH
jgi:hypothetical protein